MKNRLILLLLTVLSINSCQLPDLTEVKIDQKGYYLEITTAKNCKRSGGGISEFNCGSITNYLNGILREELSQRYKALTGIYLTEITYQFQETGKRNPFRFDIKLRIKKEKYKQQYLPYKEIINLLETHYNLRVNYSPRDYSFYQVTIENLTKFEKEVAKKYPTDQPDLINLYQLESTLQKRYSKKIAVRGLHSNVHKILLELPQSFDDLNARLNEIGLTIKEKTIQIPYPSIQYL